MFLQRFFYRVRLRITHFFKIANKISRMTSWITTDEPWCRHAMEALSASLALCEETGGFPSQNASDIVCLLSSTSVAHTTNNLQPNTRKMEFTTVYREWQRFCLKTIPRALFMLQISLLRHSISWLHFIKENYALEVSLMCYLFISVQWGQGRPIDTAVTIACGRNRLCFTTLNTTGKIHCKTKGK